jgi:hypothetical protein
MNRKATMVLISLFFCGPVAFAQEEGEEGAPVETLDVTMRLMPEGATLPDAVTKVIELPAAAADQATESAAPGLETANEARDNRGAEQAADAAEQGRERGQQMREQAQENRENAGRGEPPATPPGAPNGPPGGPPANPPGGPGN